MKIKNMKLLGFVIIAAVTAIWLLNGYYTVHSGENAVVLRFGKHIKTIEDAGLHWRLPSPIDTVEIINVVEPRRIEIGFVTIREGSMSYTPEYKSVPSQSLMLTGDENLVNVETAIQYRIRIIEDYLFNVDDQDKTLQIAAEAAIRRVVANYTLDQVLTTDKLQIQNDIKNDLQGICDNYEIGVLISAVQLQDVNPPSAVDAAFKDVVNAREDRNSYVNEAESYANQVVPLARGNAAKMINDAEAYKQKRISEARGDVANFQQVLESYETGREVTRTRMYLEMMEEILPGINKYIVDKDSGNLIKFLPLD